MKVKSIEVTIPEGVMKEFLRCVAKKPTPPAEYPEYVTEALQRFYISSRAHIPFRLLTEYLTIQSNSEDNHWITLDVFICAMTYIDRLFKKTRVGGFATSTYANDTTFHLAKRELIQTKDKWEHYDFYGWDFSSFYINDSRHAKGEPYPKFLRINGKFLKAINWLSDNKKIIVEVKETPVEAEKFKKCMKYSSGKEKRINHIDLRPLARMRPYASFYELGDEKTK